MNQTQHDQTTALSVHVRVTINPGSDENMEDQQPLTVLLKLGDPVPLLTSENDKRIACESTESSGETTRRTGVIEGEAVTTVNELGPKAMCPLCHAVDELITIRALDDGVEWRCRRCGQRWSALRLATVAAYESYTLDRE